MLEFVALRDDPKKKPWGLWGAIIAIVTAFALLIFGGLDNFRSLWTILTAVAFIGLGAMAARFGPRSSLRETRLGFVDLQRGSITLGNTAVPFDSVTEIIYGMVRYPVSKTPGAVRVQAFTVLARYGDNDLFPIIEASPDKNAAYNVARLMASWTGLEISHVGLGVRRSQ